jgi:RsiW-degrading membrane proteinase PrsW (M82 family)
MGAIPERVYDPGRGTRTIGLVLYIVLMLIAGTLLLAMFLLTPLLETKSDPETEYTAMAVGAMFALPALFVYLWLPWIIDRYDPEPLWALTLVLLWGAIGACGFAAVINTLVGGIAEAMVPDSGEAVAACISAPIFEEGLKGLGVLGMYWFVRREFDGVVDGIIYATFCALGFAACENILYYGHAASEQMRNPDADGIFVGTVVMRGIMSPWIHPLFTSMTGIGVGIARETSKGWVRWLAPMGGYCVAVILHSTWNTAATLSGMLTILMFPLWLVFIIGFFAIVITLVMRKGRIIKQHLQDEVLLGNLTPQELDLVSSAWAHWRATFNFGGSLGRQFVTTAARLGLSKWHAGRAIMGRSRTVSADFVVPLRQDLRRLRDEISRKLGYQLPQPQPWRPPAGPQYAQQPQPPPNPYSPWGR